MSASASILRLLSPRGCNWAAVPGGKADINQATVAAALRGLRPELVDLGYALWVGDRQSVKELKRWVRYEIYRHGIRPRDLAAYGLAESAVVEFLNREKCFRCNGSGQVFCKDTQDGKDRVRDKHCTDGAGQLLTDCDQCSGAGVKRWTMSRRAKEAGLNHRSYGRRYAGARDAGYQALCTWLEELASHLSVQLQEQ